MNERIRELAEQCYHRYSEHNINLEKFAELVVRECLTLREDMSSLDAMKDEEIGSAAMVRVADAAFNIYYNKIKEHFGVSE